MAVVTKIVLPMRRGMIKQRFVAVRTSFENWAWDHMEIISMTIIAMAVLAAAIYIASLYPPPIMAGR